MNKIISVLFIFFFPVATVAAPGIVTPKCIVAPLYKPVGFIPDDMKYEFEHISHLRNSSDSTISLFYKRGEYFNNGSAVAISNQNHFLTAGHVMKDCLVDAGMYAESPQGVWTKTSKPFPVTCPGTAGRLLTILAAGKCWSDPKNDKVCPGDEDYAVGHNEVKNKSCMKIRQDLAPQTNEQIVIYGFPGATDGRSPNGNSNGMSAYFSIGKVLDRSEKGCVGIDWKDGKRTEFFQELNLENLSSIVRATADSTHGNSGGPVIDRDGKLIGIQAAIFRIVSNGKYVECKGATFFIPVDKIMEKVKKQITPEQFEQITNCQ